MSRGTLLLILALLLAALPHPATAESGDKVQALLEGANNAYAAQDFKESARLFRKALKSLSSDENIVRAVIAYDLACTEALQGRSKQALEALRVAVKAGYESWEHMVNDPDLASLHEEEAFREIVASTRTTRIERRVFVVTKWENPDLGWAAEPTFDAYRSDQMEELRSKYHLADVFAGKDGELEKQMAILEWVHNRWAHDGMNQPSKKDALTILAEVEEGKHFRCVEYAVVVAQCLEAIGYPARVVGLARDGKSYGFGKGHVVAEVWNDELQSWILFDGQNNGTWRHQGRLLGATEIRDLYLAGKTAELEFVRGASSWRQSVPDEAARDEWVSYFYHLQYSSCNTFFDKEGCDTPGFALVAPDERYELLFQGNPVRGLEQTSAIERAYPALNRAHIDVETDADAKEHGHTLRVRLNHSAPWFDHYLLTVNGARSMQSEGELTWTLSAGSNSLEVRTVNAAGIEGKPSEIDIDYYPPAPHAQ